MNKEAFRLFYEKLVVPVKIIKLYSILVTLERCVSLKQVLRIVQALPLGDYNAKKFYSAFITATKKGGIVDQMKKLIRHGGVNKLELTEIAEGEGNYIFENDGAIVLLRCPKAEMLIFAEDVVPPI
jgi:hypothetical protein